MMVVMVMMAVGLVDPVAVFIHFHFRVIMVVMVVLVFILVVVIVMMVVVLMLVLVIIVVVMVMVVLMLILVVVIVMMVVVLVLILVVIVVMMMVLILVIIVVMVVLVLILVIIVVMVMMLVLILILVMFFNNFREDLGLKVRLTLNSLEDLFAVQFSDRSCDDRSLRVMLTKNLDALGDPGVARFICSGEDDRTGILYLVDEKLSKVLDVKLAFGCIYYSCGTVEYHVGAFCSVLYRLHYF